MVGQKQPNPKSATKGSVQIGVEPAIYKKKQEGDKDEESIKIT
jgi:hypothetical protein